MDQLQDKERLPRHEYAQLLCKVKMLPLKTTILDEPLLKDSEKEKLQVLIHRRLSGEPLQYLLGSQAFWGRDFNVNPNVLIPRPETEGLVEWLLSFCSEMRFGRILELGSGSGCIALTLALERPGLSIVSTDSSSLALEVAHENEKKFEKLLQSKVTWLKVASGKPLLSDYQGLGTFDVLVSNPPYLVGLSEVEPSVIRYEPVEALFSNEDPFLYYDFLNLLMNELSIPYGFFEVPHERAEEISQRFSCGKAELKNDLTGRPRYLKVCG